MAACVMGHSSMLGDKDMMNNWILGDLDDMIFGDCKQQISER